MIHTNRGHNHFSLQIMPYPPCDASQFPNHAWAFHRVQLRLSSSQQSPWLSDHPGGACRAPGQTATAKGMMSVILVHPCMFWCILVYNKRVDSRISVWCCPRHHALIRGIRGVVCTRMTDNRAVICTSTTKAGLFHTFFIFFILENAKVLWTG
jgi:hypothetical protein